MVHDQESYCIPAGMGGIRVEVVGKDDRVVAVGHGKGNRYPVGNTSYWVRPSVVMCLCLLKIDDRRWMILLEVLFHGLMIQT